ncbi:hypothetical protein GY45DRAFT_186228 [Cubamyces sp. BRFM 1775]|nr:hypothetical protein GY45DRAFT_186228 [Cubamyces sp. BRFM 1775]
MRHPPSFTHPGPSMLHIFAPYTTALGTPTICCTRFPYRTHAAYTLRAPPRSLECTVSLPARFRSSDRFTRFIGGFKRVYVHAVRLSSAAFVVVVFALCGVVLVLYMLSILNSHLRTPLRSGLSTSRCKQCSINLVRAHRGLRGCELVAGGTEYLDSRGTYTDSRAPDIVAQMPDDLGLDD